MNNGSRWRRWEPHIHGPGTALNDQFSGNWETYLNAIETASPKIEVLGLTDYYSMEVYEALLSEKSKGRLPKVSCVFPNVELRLNVAAKSGFVNIHLLVSPDSDNHIEEVTRFLNGLTFTAYGDLYHCNKADIIRLGKTSDPNIVDEKAAFAQGATQFKTDFDQLKNNYNKSDWAKEHILIAVAGGQSDGTSGVRAAADRTVRIEIEKFAHVIFSSNPNQREFWLGKKPSTSIATLRDVYNGRKPCLHGSDAHDDDKVANPDNGRFSWIKGEPCFDALKQACIEPEGRAYVGADSPTHALSSQTICSAKFTNMDWLTQTEVHLNPGLVAIIGARGSGKTALADILAAACDAIPLDVWDDKEKVDASFLARAKPLLENSSVEINWGDGDKISQPLDGPSSERSSHPRARYLSQQFVEKLCAASGITDGLRKELERVVFEAHSPAEKEGAPDFQALLDRRIGPSKLKRKTSAEAISTISRQISQEMTKSNKISSLVVEIARQEKELAALEEERKRTIPPQNSAVAALHHKVSVERDKRQSEVNSTNRQKQLFDNLYNEVASQRSARSPATLRDMQSRYVNSGVPEADWERFLLDFTGDVDEATKRYQDWASTRIRELTGVMPESGLTADQVSSLKIDSDISNFSFVELEAYLQALAGKISVEAHVRKKYTAITQKIGTLTASISQKKENLDDCKGAEERRSLLYDQRDVAYKDLFEAIIEYQTMLEKLYQPLLVRLNESAGTLKRLSFNVHRVVDHAGWAAEAEKHLIDLRRTSPFRGTDTLTNVVSNELLPTWQHGTAQEISDAMKAFRQSYRSEFLKHSPVDRDDKEKFNRWSTQFTQWLFGSDHIRVEYGITYDGVEIENLSPGTRGIVLLLLYLALDSADTRPLIIDQPEENLDPKSVFDELVGLFVETKTRRQVIIVTHNANLVVNTDADQIIIANSTHHRNGGLPEINYMSGGLESSNIRSEVCGILEGGEPAFRERARRLRVKLER